MTRVHEVNRLGQSIWLDFIRRSLITSGELNQMIKDGLSGVTSNPTIFEKAISGGAEYDADIRQYARLGKSTYEIYEALAIKDIQMAADALRPVYDRTEGVDGTVSFEVNPELAHNSADTLCEARRLFAAVHRPNVMIKVPATREGVSAIEGMITEGINTTATLIFSEAHYRAVALAYLSGLEKLVDAGGHVQQVTAVAALFVSRLDAVIDAELEKLGHPELAGKAAIANAKILYSVYKELFSGARWEALAARGARPQRLVWASTGTKNPTYPNTLYVDALIGPNTVNTLPPAVLSAFMDHGRVSLTLENDLEGARGLFKKLESLGISLSAVTDQLQVDAVASFTKSFKDLLASIEKKRQQ